MKVLLFNTWCGKITRKLSGIKVKGCRVVSKKYRVYAQAILSANADFEGMAIKPHIGQKLSL